MGVVVVVVGVVPSIPKILRRKLLFHFHIFLSHFYFQLNFLPFCHGVKILGDVTVSGRGSPLDLLPLPHPVPNLSNPFNHVSTNSFWKNLYYLNWKLSVCNTSVNVCICGICDKIMKNFLIFLYWLHCVKIVWGHEKLHFLLIFIKIEIMGNWYFSELRHINKKTMYPCDF